MMITLKNSLHNTETRVRVGESMVLSRSQVARARRKLCGMPDCRCASTALGTYGDSPEGPEGTFYGVDDLYDGRVELVEVTR